MSSEHVHEFTDSNFDSQVLSSPVPVLVDFWAPWCQPCQMLTPLIEDVAKEFEGRVRVGKVNTDENRGVGTNYQIFSLPTVIVFKNGQEFRRFQGLARNQMQKMVEALQQALEVPA